MTTRDVVLYFAIFALISLGGMWIMDLRARKQKDDKIARELRAFSDEYNRGR